MVEKKIGLSKNIKTLYLYFLFAPCGNRTRGETKNRETFISSDKFRGEKKGYVFKNDTKGLGYYLDI